MKFKFLLLFCSLVLLPSAIIAQNNFDGLLKSAKDAYFNNDFETALVHFENIKKLSSTKNDSWKSYYDKCLKAYIRSLKKDLLASEAQLENTLTRVGQKDSLYKETNFELENKKTALKKLEAEKLVLQSLYTSPYQKWEKAALVLEANRIASELRPADRPKELFAAILDASLNLGENSWNKNILEGVSLQHINFDDATEKLALGFSNGQTTKIDSFLNWIEHPDSIFEYSLSDKVDLEYPIQDWVSVVGEENPVFVAGPRIYNLNMEDAANQYIVGHEKSYIKGILPMEPKTLVSFGSDGFVNKFDLSTNTSSQLMKNNGIITDVIKRTKDGRIYFASSTGELFKISENSTSNLSTISNTLPNQISRVHIIEQVPVKETKKSILMTGQESGEITFYELGPSKTKYIRRFAIHKGKVEFIEQHDNKLYVYAQDGMVSIWDIDSMLASYTYTPISFQMEPMVKALKFIPKKQLILYGTKEGDLKAISMDFEQHVQTICQKYIENNPLEESEELPEFLKQCKQ